MLFRSSTDSVITSRVVSFVLKASMEGNKPKPNSEVATLVQAEKTSAEKIDIKNNLTEKLDTMNVICLYLDASSLYKSKYSVKSESHPLNGITFFPLTEENSETNFLSMISDPKEIASA